MSPPSTPPGYDTLADMLPCHLSGTRTPPRPVVVDVVDPEPEPAVTPTLIQGSLSAGTSPALVTPSPSALYNFAADEFSADNSSSSTDTEAPGVGVGLGGGVGAGVGKAKVKSAAASVDIARVESVRVKPRGQLPGRLSVKTSQQVIKEVDEKMEGVVKGVEEITDRIYLVCKPFSDKALSFAENRPLLFTLVALWALFSAIPVLCFLGFLAFAAVSIASVAAFFICVTIFGIILAGVSALIGSLVLSSAILLPILCLTTLLAISSLAFLLALFLAHRLYLHLAASTTEELSAQTLSDGVRRWAGESVERVEEAVGGGFGVGRGRAAGVTDTAGGGREGSAGLEKDVSPSTARVKEKTPSAHPTTPPPLSSQTFSFNEKTGLAPLAAAGRDSVPLPKGHPEHFTAPIEGEHESVFAPSHL